MTKIDRLAADFCAALTTRADLPPTAVQIAVWLLGAAKLTGEHPIQLIGNDFLSGVTRNGVFLTGTGIHRRTLTQAIDALEEQGYLTRTPGTVLRGGATAFYYTIQVPTP